MWNKNEDGQQSSTLSLRKSVWSMYIFANQTAKPEIRPNSQQGPHLSTSTVVVLRSYGT